MKFVCIAVMLAGAAQIAQADSFTYTTINVPGGVLDPTPSAINDLGEVAGAYDATPGPSMGLSIIWRLPDHLGS